MEENIKVRSFRPKIVADLTSGGRGRGRCRRGLLAARRRLAERRREQGGRAVSGKATAISGEKPAGPDQ